MNPREFSLVGTTGAQWAPLAAANLPALMTDHAVCEQQAALNALTLIGQYGGDALLVERLAALAQEEIVHFRRVTALCAARGWPVYVHRKNEYASALRKLARSGREPEQYLDRMLLSALIEARSSERFERLLEAVTDPEAAAILREFSPAEERHFELFLELAARKCPEADIRARWTELSAAEGELNASLGRVARIHG